MSIALGCTFYLFKFKFLRFGFRLFVYSRSFRRFLRQKNTSCLLFSYFPNNSTTFFISTILCFNMPWSRGLETRKKIWFHGRHRFSPDLMGNPWVLVQHFIVLSRSSECSICGYNTDLISVYKPWDFMSDRGIYVRPNEAGTGKGPNHRCMA